jgi:MAE_28990/MAE_18760-like HEPN
MRIKSEAMLIDFLSKQSQMRRRELITFSELLKSKRDHELNIMCRTSIVLAYANWEGFVKESAAAYVDYVDSKSLPFNQLSVNFQAIACRTMLLKSVQATKRISPHLELINHFTSNSFAAIQVCSKAAIDTESNLNKEIFENICVTIGIDYHVRWSRWGPFINDLVKNRCSIAHGDFWIPERRYAQEAVKYVGDFIDWFKTDIENAAVTSTYVKI